MKKISDIVYSDTIVRGNYVKDHVILRRIIEETRKHELRVHRTYGLSKDLELRRKLNNQIMLLEGTAPVEFEKIVRRILKNCGHESQRGFFSKLFREKYVPHKLAIYIYTQLDIIPSSRLSSDFEFMSYHEVLAELIKLYQQKMIRQFKGIK